MNTTRLKSMVQPLMEIPTDGLSDIALISLARIYISMHNLIAVNSLDNEYGDRKIFRNQITRLKKACRIRCVRNTCFQQRAPMVRILFSLIDEPVCCFTDPEEATDCWDTAGALIRDYLEERGKSPESKLKAEPEEEFEVLRCIIHLLYFLPEYDEEEKRFLHYVKEKMAGWIRQMNAYGEWSGLSEAQALQRIDIMNRHAGLCPDAVYADRIRQAYRYYSCLIFPELIIMSGVPLEKTGILGWLYDVAMQHNTYPRDRIRAAKIAKALYERSRSFPPESDEWFWCIGYVVDNLCEEIMDEIQQQTMQPTV